MYLGLNKIKIGRKRKAAGFARLLLFHFWAFIWAIGRSSCWAIPLPRTSSCFLAHFFISLICSPSDLRSPSNSATLELAHANRPLFSTTTTSGCRWLGALFTLLVWVCLSIFLLRSLVLFFFLKIRSLVLVLDSKILYTIYFIAHNY